MNEKENCETIIYEITSIIFDVVKLMENDELKQFDDTEKRFNEEYKKNQRTKEIGSKQI